MIFALSNTVITDTVRSLAAYHSLTSGPAERRALDPLLDGSHRALLVNMTRQAFAEIALRLLPFATDFTLCSETSTSDVASIPPRGPEDDDIMKIELTTPGGLTARAGSSLRRALEQAVAMTALARLAGAAGVDSPAVERMIGGFNRQAADALSALTGALSAPAADCHPFVRD